ncbi:MAG: AAA family ATPase [bacterium]|nr:AAA family ATPase [bacterium]
MKKSIFITGIAGSGKTTISRAFKDMGYEAYDIEDDQYGLFMMIRRDTGERYTDYDNADPEKTKNALWVCDLAKLKELINKQTNDIAFYCGIASKNEELMPFFDKSFVLQADSEILYKRLLSREGTDDYGNTEAGRQGILKNKDEFEEKMIQAGMIGVKANTDATEVAKAIIDLSTPPVREEADGELHIHPEE